MQALFNVKFGNVIFGTNFYIPDLTMYNLGWCELLSRSLAVDFIPQATGIAQ